jgi:tetratricopeptide (TPR) repeat protein
MNGQSAAQVSLDLGTLVSTLYHQMPMTQENSAAVRAAALALVANAPEDSSAVRAVALALVANVSISDYLNSWNEASRSREEAKKLLKAAENAAKEAVALNDKLALAHYARGLVHRARRQRPHALKELNRAIELHDRFARAYSQRANELIKDGKFEEALQDIDNALEYGSDDASAGIFYWNRGRAYFFLKAYEKAIEALTEAVRRRPNLWYTWLYLISAYALNEEKPFRTAKRWLKKFREQNPLKLKDEKLTLEKVISYEDANPTDSQAVEVGRKAFHDGLRRVGF